MQLRCPNCDAHIPARQINVQEMIAVCADCDTVFKPTDYKTSLTAKRRKLSKPPKFDVVETADHMEISYLYRQNMGWLEFLVLGIAAAVSSVLTLGTAELLANQSFIPALIAFGVALIAFYFVAAVLLNRRTIVIDEDYLTHQETPFPAMSNYQYRQDEVVGFHTKRMNTLDDPIKDYYTIYVQLIDGTEAKFVEAVPRNYAAYIEQMIQNHMHQPDEMADPFMDNAADDLNANLSMADGEISTDADTDLLLNLDELLHDDQHKNRG